MQKIKIAQFGLGPIGIETVKLAATRSWAKVVGAVDISPKLAGRSLGEITGVPELNSAGIYPTFEDLAAMERPDLVFHTSVSRIQTALNQLDPIVRRGVSVVSSCEELLFPTLRAPELAASFDRLCKQHDARVLGTGVNPGYVMDLLPVCLTGVCSKVEAIHVQRVVNATTRRGPLQKKIGSGLAPGDFEKLFAEGRAGHAGLKESAALMAHAMGWRLDHLVETCKAVVADHDISTPHVQVKAGQTCGLHQHAVGKMAGKTRLTLDLKMYLDAPDPHDACQVEGNPPLRLLIEGGVAGDAATIAALVNAAPRVLRASPGLLLMTDISVPCLA